MKSLKLNEKTGAWGYRLCIPPLTKLRVLGYSKTLDHEESLCLPYHP
jgi:hypothetical protein